MTRSQKALFLGSWEAEQDYWVATRYLFQKEKITISQLREAVEYLCWKHPLLLSSLSTEEKTRFIFPWEPQDLIGESYDNKPSGVLAFFTISSSSSPTSLGDNTCREDSGQDSIELIFYAHHIILDAGAIRIWEKDCAHILHRLSIGDHCPLPGEEEILEAYTALTQAQSYEESAAAAAEQKFIQKINCSMDSDKGKEGGSAPRLESILGSLPMKKARAYATIKIDSHVLRRMQERSQQWSIPMNSILMTAVAAVHIAYYTGITKEGVGGGITHTIDPRSSHPDLEVVSCVVNSLYQSLSFPVLLSCQEAVRRVDRDYVRLQRQPWLREELVRRYLLHQGEDCEGVAINILSSTVAVELEKFLIRNPEIIDLGPCEGRTVQFLLPEETIVIWDREDTESHDHELYAYDLAQALDFILTHPEQPLAQAAGAWKEYPVFSVEKKEITVEKKEINREEKRRKENRKEDNPGDSRREEYKNALQRAGFRAGDIAIWEGEAEENREERADSIALICAIDDLKGGYCYCPVGKGKGSSESTGLNRAQECAQYFGGSVHTVYIPRRDTFQQELFILRRGDDESAITISQGSIYQEDIAYIMSTSGTTGDPKLVPITRKGLESFLRHSIPIYGWSSEDKILQLNDLNSDISVEEIIISHRVGAQIYPSRALIEKDVQLLCEDIARCGITILDLPTAAWRMICADSVVLDFLHSSTVHSIVIGGEAVDFPSAQLWLSHPVSQTIRLLSTYGPTESTIVVTAIDITKEMLKDSSSPRAVGYALAPGSVYEAFGELIACGEIISPGYITSSSGDCSHTDPKFTKGVGSTQKCPIPNEKSEAAHFPVQRIKVDGGWKAAYATGDRVIYGSSGQPEFGGRRDSMVKISGHRYDLQYIRAQIENLPNITVHTLRVERGRMIIEYTGENSDALRECIYAMGISSVDWREFNPADMKVGGNKHEGYKKEKTKSQILAEEWSSYMGFYIDPEKSLIDYGVGSIDIMSLVPISRKICGLASISIRDILSAGSASRLLEVVELSAHWGGEKEKRLRTVLLERKRKNPQYKAVALVGSSGNIGSALVEQWVQSDYAQAGFSDLILLSRSKKSENTYREHGIYIHDGSGYESSDSMMRSLEQWMSAGLVHCVINAAADTTMITDYDSLKTVNVDMPRVLTSLCMKYGSSLVHLSSTVVENSSLHTHPYNRSKYEAEKGMKAEIQARIEENNAGDKGVIASIRIPRVKILEEKKSESIEITDREVGDHDVLSILTEACMELGVIPDVDVKEDIVNGSYIAQIVKEVAEEITFSPLWEDDPKKRYENDDGLWLVHCAPEEVIDYRNYWCREWLLQGKGGGEVERGEKNFTEDDSLSMPVIPLLQWKEVLNRSQWSQIYPGKKALVHQWIELYQIWKGGQK